MTTSHADDGFCALEIERSIVPGARMSAYRKPFSRAGYATGTATTSTNAGKRGKRKLPELLYERVDVGKIELESVKPWIGTRITELLGVEDDVLIGMIGVLLEETRVHKSCEDIYAQLASFLEADAETFCVELWELLTSAQANAAKGLPGIPQKFLDDKRREMERADAAYERMRDNQRRRDDASARRKPYRDERKNRDDGFRDRRRDSRSPPRQRERQRDPQRRSRWETAGEASD